MAFRLSGVTAKRRKNEDCLNDIVFGFARVAERKAEIREERKLRAEEERERERIRHQKIVEVQKEKSESSAWTERFTVGFRVNNSGRTSQRASNRRTAEQPVDKEWVDWARINQVCRIYFEAGVSSCIPTQPTRSVAGSLYAMRNSD